MQPLCHRPRCSRGSTHGLVNRSCYCVALPSSRGARAAGLTLLNLSLDTLQPAKFEAMTRRPGLQRVLGSLQQALDLGFAPVKVGLSCSPVLHSRCKVKRMIK